MLRSILCELDLNICIKWTF